jgi:hypothetical protein
MKPINKAKEAREQKRYARLGTDSPSCVSCGETDWRCFEQHHIAGQAYHDDMGNVCCNCHRKLTDDQQDHPKPVSKPPTVIETIGRYLIGLADIFAMMVDTLRAFGNTLIDMARGEALAT